MATAINIEAEQQAIITILNSSEDYREIQGKLLGALTADDFGADPANEVMAKVQNIIRKGKDIPRRNVFASESTLSDEAKEFLQNIEYKPLKDKDSAEALIDQLKFHRKIRKILNTAREMAEECKKATPDDINAIESKLDQLTMDIKGSENQTRIVTFGSGDRSVAEEIIQNITQKNDAKRIKTGFDYFDGRAGGARRGHAFLIAGPSGGGKSAMANQLLINMYQKEKVNTLFVSFEMDEEECVARMASNVCGIDFSHVEQKNLTPAEATKLVKEIEKFHEHGEKNDCWFKVWSPSDNLTASNIISYCKPIKPDVLVVDYIGLLGQDNPKEEQWKSLGSAMRQFKLAAKKLDCLIIVLAQFDQEAMVVKYARALREHANIMWCWTYGPKEEETGVVTIRQKAPWGKNRNCPPFDFRVKYELSMMRIHDFGKADEEDDVKMTAAEKSKLIKQQPGLAKTKNTRGDQSTSKARFEEE